VKICVNTKIFYLCKSLLLVCTPTPTSFIRQALVGNIDMLAVCAQALWKVQKVKMNQQKMCK